MGVRLRVFALVAVVVTAGCGGFFGGPETPDRDPFDAPTATSSSSPVPAAEPTLTPVATPDRPPVMPDEPPPGVSAGRVAQPISLANAHAATISAEPHTVDHRYVERYPNGSVRVSRTLDAVVIDDRRYFVRIDDRTVIDEYYADGDHLYRAIQPVDGSRGVMAGFESNDPAGEFPVDTTYRTRIYRLFQAVEMATVTSGPNRTAPDTYVVAADGFDQPSLLVEGEFTAVRNVSAIVHVDASGYISRYRLTYVKVVDGRPIRVVETLNYYRVGSATLDAPGWYDEVATRADAATDEVATVELVVAAPGDCPEKGTTRAKNCE